MCQVTKEKKSFFNFYVLGIVSQAYFCSFSLFKNW